MRFKNLKFLIPILIFIVYLNVSLAEEFLPVYNFKIDNKTYLFSIYRANPEEVVLIYDYDPKDTHLDEAKAKITGRIEFNFSNNTKMIGVLNKDKTSIRLTNFINLKKKTNQKISTPWLKLDEFATHTEIFKIGDQEYKISFPIYKNQVKINNKYDDKNKKFDMILITNDKMNVSWNETGLYFSIRKYNQDNVFKETLNYIGDMTRTFSLENYLTKEEISNHPLKILFKNPKYGDLVFSYLDPIVGNCINVVYKNDQNINYGCIKIKFLNSPTNTKPSLALTKKILQEILNKLEENKAKGIIDTYRIFISVLFKNAILKNIDEVSKKYEKINFSDKEIYSTKGKEIITSEDMLNDFIYDYLESQEISEKEIYNQKIKNKNYSQFIKKASGDAGYLFREFIFFFDYFIISIAESYDPSGALLPYKVKKHPLQIKLGKNIYSKFPIYDKFKYLFDLMIKSFYIQNKEGEFIPQLKTDNLFYQDIYLEYPPVDMEYIKNKLKEKGYSADIENVI